MLRLFVPFLIAASLNSIAFAGVELVSKESKEVIAESPFDKGRIELQVSTGAYTSLDNNNVNRPRITDVDASIRLGWMLYTPAGAGFLRGNFEFLLEAAGGLDIQGPKTGTVGGNLMLRYNFVQPSAWCVPYFQIQAGGLYTNIDHDLEQREIGRDEEFFLGAGAGLHFFIDAMNAISLEADFRHISNADTADRNIGLNSIGGLLGFSHYF